MSSEPIRTGSFPWPIVAIFAIVAVVTGAPSVIVLAMGALGVWIIVAVTGRLALTAVEVTLALAPDRLVAGEPAIATLTVSNRKPLPLTWVDARLLIGDGVDPASAMPGKPRGWVDSGPSPRRRDML